MILTGSDIIVRSLIEQGVERVFGYPGGQVIHIYDSLYKYQEEIDHILTYLQIQQMRFGDRINYILTVQQEMRLEEYRVIPLLLQPIVENAIVHGLESKEHSGTISISIYHIDDMVYVDISDNGCGIEEENLKKLLTNYLKRCKDDSNFCFSNVEMMLEEIKKRDV